MPNSVNKKPDTTNTLEDLVLSFFGDEVGVISEGVNQLKKVQKGAPLDIFDFDDTLHSRKETLKIEGLKNNRGDFGNKWILAKYSGKLEKVWREIFGENHTGYRDEISFDKDHTTFHEHALVLGEENLGRCIWSVLVEVDNLSQEQKEEAYLAYAKEFYSKTRESDVKIGLISNVSDLVHTTTGRVAHIITATTAPELTRAKLRLTGVNQLPHTIVPDGKTKIPSLIEIVLELGYIPAEIIVYEDKPEYFFKYGTSLSQLFGTKIIVKKVNIGEDNNLKIEEERTYEEEV